MEKYLQYQLCAHYIRYSGSFLFSNAYRCGTPEIASKILDIFYSCGELISVNSA